MSGFAGLLREHARSRPQRLAVVDGDVRLTYAELDARVDRLARGLHRRGVGSGARILWLAQNSHRALECLLAAARLGANLCCANWRWSVDELRFAVEDVRPDMVIWQSEEIGDKVAQVRAAVSTAAVWMQHDAIEDGWEEMLAAAESAPLEIGVDLGMPLLWLYTAAFEGRPNAAMLPHRALIAQGMVLARVQEATESTVTLNCTPLFHVATWSCICATLFAGGTNVFVRRVDAEELCRTVEAERCDKAFLPPPAIAAMREANAGGRFDLTSLWPAGTAMSWQRCMPTWSPATGRTGGYGQTETTGAVTFFGVGPEPIGAHGRPAPLTHLRIVDPNGADAPQGEAGEIVLRSPLLMTGYHDRAELNLARWAGGWFHTNDLGRRESDGSLTFIGPRQALIKSASENIYPVEVERCLREHPAVGEASVIGVPDPRWTQRVKAVVVLAPGARVDAAELIEFCRSRIGSYKKPSEVVFVESLPRRADGGVDRDAVDAAHGGGGYPGVATAGATR